MKKHPNSHIAWTGNHILFVLLVFTMNSNVFAFDQNKFYEKISETRGIYDAG